MSIISEKIQVILRIRPPRRNDLTTTTKVDINKVFVKDKAFYFDNIYDTQATQLSIFTESIKPLIDHFLSGINTTIFTYGQTGSGKTYTMGTDQTNVHFEDDNCGIIPRFLLEVFRKKKSLPNHQFQFSIQFLELYNEEIRDLLVLRNPAAGSIKIVETKSTGIVLTGLSERTVNSPIEALFYLNEGNKARTTASTSMNAESSRSHAIFTVHLTQTRVTDKLRGLSESIKSKFHFVDLAGSERLQRTRASGTRAKEGIHINYGLLALGNVICALSDSSLKPTLKRHVPYRDSKLTRLLEDSLGGRAKCMMIACVCPSTENVSETVNTLSYAQRVRCIKTDKLVAVAVNNRANEIDCHNCQTMEQRIRELEHELSVLKNRNETGYVDKALEEQASRVLDFQRNMTNALVEDSMDKLRSFCHLKSLENNLHLLECLPTTTLSMTTSMMPATVVGSVTSEKRKLCEQINEEKERLRLVKHEEGIGKKDDTLKILIDFVNTRSLKTEKNELELENCVTRHLSQQEKSTTQSYSIDRLRWIYLLNFSCQELAMRNYLQQKIIDFYDQQQKRFYDIFKHVLCHLFRYTTYIDRPHSHSMETDLIHRIMLDYSDQFNSILTTKHNYCKESTSRNPASLLASLENDVDRLFPLLVSSGERENNDILSTSFVIANHNQRNNDCDEIEAENKENNDFYENDEDMNEQIHYNQLAPVPSSSQNATVPSVITVPFDHDSTYSTTNFNASSNIIHHKPIAQLSRKKSMIINQEGTVLAHGFLKPNGLCLPIISSPRKQKLFHTQSLKPTYGSLGPTNPPLPRKRKAESINIVKNFRSRFLMNNNNQWKRN